ncbi:unnamed protein product, partial [Prorocentrum cordatum]
QPIHAEPARAPILERRLLGRPEPPLAPVDPVRGRRLLDGAPQPDADDRHRGAADTIADVFHANMRDRLGGATKMEIFHVCFVDTLTQLPQHLIGLRENSDSDLLDRHLVPEPDHAPCQPGMAVVFDALTFKVLEVSTEFVKRFGPCRASAVVCDWLDLKDPTVEVMCDNINLFANGAAPTCSFELWPLTLRLTCSGPADYPASFMLTRVQSDDGEDQIVAFMVLPPCGGMHHGLIECGHSHSGEARARAATNHGADPGRGHGLGSEAGSASERAQEVRTHRAERLLAELAHAEAAAAAPGAPLAAPFVSTSRSSSSWAWGAAAEAAAAALGAPLAAPSVSTSRSSSSSWAHAAGAAAEAWPSPRAEGRVAGGGGAAQRRRSVSPHSSASSFQTSI